MSTDGENAKNQSSELDDSKPNLDSTDSSQESSQDAVKSEGEENQENKTENEEKLKEKSAESEVVEKKVEEKVDKKVEVNDKENNDEKVKTEAVEEKKPEENEEKNGKKEKVKEEKKKEEKNEEKTDDDTEEGDGSEEGDEDDEKKDVPLLDQPLEQSGTRERKKVQRFDKEYTNEPKESVKIEIPTGSGSQLSDIPRIDASISRFKTDDLKLLHRILFKNPGKATLIKKNIRKFNGFDFKKDSDDYSRKLSFVQKLEMKQLKSVCEMLDLAKTGNKEEISERICEFLLDPKDSGKPTAGGRPKRTAAVRANNRGYSSHEDADDASDSDTPRSRSKRGKGRRVNLKDESSSEDEFNPSDSEDEEGKPKVKRGRGRSAGAKKKQESDEEISDVEETPSSEDSDEPKAKKKRGPVAKVQNNRNKKTPAKSPGRPGRKPANSTPAKAKQPAKRGRKKKEESSEEEKDSEENNAESSSEDEPLIKKNKSPQPPSDEEIKTYVKEILEGANLEEITMKTVCKQVYAHYPDFDLAHKKDFIKTTVKSLIST